LLWFWFRDRLDYQPLFAKGDSGGNRDSVGKRSKEGNDMVFFSLQGLKSHAVTMFEVGKLTDESLDSFLGELEKASFDCRTCFELFL